MTQYDLWFNDLYLKNSKKMVSYAYRTLKDWELAEDLVHAVFTTLVQKGPSMMDHKQPVAWLYKALYYHIGNEFQRAANRWEELFDPQETEFGKRDQYFSPEEYFPAGLTAEERDILRLQIFERADYQEMAAYFGKTEAACRTKLCRARARCKELLQKEKEFENPCNNSQNSTNIEDRRCKDARRS